MKDESKSPVPNDNYGAFEYSSNRLTDSVKALCSIAYLLDWSSEIGNKDVDGTVAQGLSFLIREAVEDVGDLYTRDEIHESGGDADSVARRAASPEEAQQRREEINAAAIRKITQRVKK